MTEVPRAVRSLAAEREEARRIKDFTRADALRDRIRELGYEVTDTPEGPVLTSRRATAEEAHGPSVYLRSGDVESRLEEEPAYEASVQWLVEGWPEDVLRGIESFRTLSSGHSVHHVVADLTRARVEWPEGVEVVQLAPEAGWAAARNAALRRAAGRVVVIADGSVEATGDVVSPFLSALEDRSVGVTGPFGIVTDDLREFRRSDGPDVDAVEAYLMAFRRQVFEDGLRFDERFAFYRNADIELSFQLKGRGLRATVTRVPVVRHEHRIWAATSEADRARLSRRNFYRFLDRWHDRTDLLVGRGNP